MPNALALGPMDADIFNDKVASLSKPALGTAMFGTVSLEKHDFIADFVLPGITMMSFSILAWIGYCCCVKRYL